MPHHKVPQLVEVPDNRSNLLLPKQAFQWDQSLLTLRQIGHAFKCGHAVYYANNYPNKAACSTLALMKQGQVSGGKRQALSVNSEQVNQVQAEAEPEELEDQEEVPVENEEAHVEDNEQQN
jgi:hypothetical protein